MSHCSRGWLGNNGRSFLVAVTSFVSEVSFGSKSSDLSLMGCVVHITKGCGTDNTGLD